MKLAAALIAALAFGALPLVTSSNYFVGIGISALLFTVAAAALNLIYGFTGLLSFAQLGFWGIGGYAAALTVVTYGGTFWSGVAWAALINVVVALVVGFPILRTNRHAFVISTLTFALLVALIARDWVDLTRGPLVKVMVPPGSGRPCWSFPPVASQSGGYVRPRLGGGLREPRLAPGRARRWQRRALPGAVTSGLLQAEVGVDVDLDAARRGVLRAGDADP